MQLVNAQDPGELPIEEREGAVDCQAMGLGPLAHGPQDGHRRELLIGHGREIFRQPGQVPLDPLAPEQEAVAPLDPRRLPRLRTLRDRARGSLLPRPGRRHRCVFLPPPHHRGDGLDVLAALRRLVEPLDGLEVQDLGEKAEVAADRQECGEGHVPAGIADRHIPVCVKDRLEEVPECRDKVQDLGLQQLAHQELALQDGKGSGEQCRR
mmetsp:Transcript_126912/g.367339  ORF Transcript_126912/g.367339 Transcript_126912/m.367339 type:complete len:209 (+) Transcript_126912:834-1460(+)